MTNFSNIDRSDFASWRDYMICRPAYFAEICDCEPTEENIRAVWEEIQYLIEVKSGNN
jgi:hypothetical protein